MLVIADIEWICGKEQDKQPTQLAAVKVDSLWNPISEFDSFIHADSLSAVPSWHVALTGGKTEDFESAPNTEQVLCGFLEWLEEDDTIVWWHHESEELLRKLIKRISDDMPRMYSLNKFVRSFLKPEEESRVNLYGLAHGKGIKTVSSLKHNSKNDVRVFRELMAAIKFPQSNILNLPEAPADSFDYHPSYQFRYEPATNKIHKADCPLTEGVETVCYKYMKTAIRKGYIPCSCCRQEYKNALKQKNIRTIQHCGFRFVYSPDSDVFHKADCHLILFAKRINGSPKYETVAKTRRKPCKFCKPTFRDAFDKPVKKANPDSLIKTNNKEHSKALARHKAAAKERSIKLNKENITEAEKKDILTLTQPRYAFWASRGYGNFHKHSCPKLNQANNLVGFSTFNEAISAGYTPCRKCKPSKKNDAVYTIPISSHTRENETDEDLITLCRDSGYKYSAEDKIFCIETPVGKWRLDTSLPPFTLEHMNLVVTPGVTKYHDQPCIFLSLTDAFYYIKRHDDDLEIKKSNGKAFVILVTNK